MRQQLFLLFTLSIVVLLLAAPVTAQGTPNPSVSVSDQQSLDGTVRINSAYSAGNGFVVIHKDNGDGTPGPVIGQYGLEPGWTYNFDIPIDATQATPTLFAMLHVDDGAVGVYEFDGQSGLDNPVSVNGQVVTQSFKINLIRALDQFVAGDQVHIAAVVAQAPGWLVIHAGDAQTFGGVLGQTLVPAGTSVDVVVNITQDGRTPVLWPMLHVDTGVTGQYEFGVVEGADGPVVTLGRIATLPIWAVPHVRAASQTAIGGDGQASSNVFRVDSVLAEVPGFLVVHNEQNGTFGPVAGLTAVPAGLSTNLSITLDPAAVTPRLWPMLHVDDTTVGTYEFGTVEGADGPVLVNGEILTFPVNSAPSLTLRDQVALTGEAANSARFTVDEAVIDARGWLAIHVDNGGQPGDVIQTALLHPGVNRNLIVEVDAAAAGSRVFPMLHYDTGTAGVYEFGQGGDADGPVAVAGSIVVAPLRLLTAAEATAGAPAAPTTAPAAPTTAPAPPAATQDVSAPPATGACTANAAPNQNVNLRTGPGINFPIQAVLQAGQGIAVEGQTTGSDGILWWGVTGGAFVRSDVVTTTGDCSNVPVMDTSGLVPPAAPPPAATQGAAPPAQPPAPAGTQEVNS